ncbi:histidine kinase [Sphingomonas sp. Leaf23]|uniref:hybrid sensor histidine kinase/response regulator n=1 Tax=Sphingomonas sp. Leaf23 TaxID=1735689 RepID=UPI0007014F29|nr:ATP-binding protein [Sphingomonas sp. Leaf23]KQM86081.1 histidine kinase [Sphingomonas sp. Leaf23]
MLSKSPSVASPVLPLAIALVAGGLAAALILWTIGSVPVAIGFVAAAIILAGIALGLRRWTSDSVAAEPVVDWSLAQTLASVSPHALAVTDRAGRLVCANDRYAALFGGYPTPPGVLGDGVDASALASAARAAWRDGDAKVTVRQGDASIVATLARAGESMLVWRFEGGQVIAEAVTMRAMIAGDAGERLGTAGVMVALLSADGRIRAANRVFRARAVGNEDATIEGRDFARFLVTDNRGRVRFEREGLGGDPLRIVQVPFVDDPAGPMLVAMLDEEEAPVGLMPIAAPGSAAQVRALVSLLPVGMALVDRDGRFLHMNDAFIRATGVNPVAPPLYPGDLVVREDKAALADAVRRFAGGAQHSADMAVRLNDRTDEPVALSIAGARGLGEAAVVLSLRDTGEEGKLKRQVAQATKMQAVGQLAGGVAHDFNNILTAIIGHCDLMLMRHAPGDSDYDDIQQIRANSNRAASLTRQLLAFSRQQTLRPQVLQLPDVISEVSNLLKRLLGETVQLVVNHGRGLGSVRADPGQLEQVVVNLAVNARDAMLSQGGNRNVLTIETLATSAQEVRAMDDDVLPVGDYVTLKVSDTGTGIPADVLPKIFEPFFTTKEVGKGTGLGLSTVYGIIKQSGGYIFAESRAGQGSTFTIHLPVHAAAAEPPRLGTNPKLKAEPAEPAWGTGTILLVEDEDMVRAIAERALTRQGYTVMTAEHGEAALELLADRPHIDLLISDVVMPTMDGPTMVGHVRKVYPTLPILFMSGYAEEQLRRSIDLDQVSFLPKPFSVQQLATAARDALAKS